MFQKGHEHEKSQVIIIIIALLCHSAQHEPEERAISILRGGGGPCSTFAFRRDWEIFSLIRVT